MIVVGICFAIDLFVLCVMAVCQLIIFVTMRQESRHSNSVVREVLKDLIHNQNNMPSTNRKNSSLEVIKLGDAVSFLQRKIERQYSQIQVLSGQLSKEISVKEELAVLLGEEKEKLSKTNQHLINANKQNAELKKKIMKMEKQQGEGDTFKAQCEIKLNKYRDIVRKKDELLTKNQQKLEQLLKTDRQTIQKEQELKSLKQTIVKLRAKEENASTQIQSLKKKHTDTMLQLEQKDRQIMTCKEQLMFASERMSRLQDQNKELNEQNNRRELQSASMIQRLSFRIRDQQYEIAELSKRRSVNLQNTQWDLQVYKNELRRVLGNCIKDNNLRRKIQRDMLQILGEIQCSFRSTLQKVISSLQV